MDLIFWRHADASEGWSDLLRELTAKGHKQARIMAEWFNRRLPDDTRILVSPATRAQQTAAALARPFHTEQALAPGADAMTLLLAAGWPEAGGTVLLVGHQPSFGSAGMLLLTGMENPMGIKKGGMIWLSNRVRQDAQQNILRAALSPELA